MENLEKVAEKVKKLLAMSQSPNPHEAALAAERARELLEKYNMSLTDVEITTSEMTESLLHLQKKGKTKGGEKVYYKKLPHWILYLLNVMQRYFYVRFLIRRRGSIAILGAQQDVQVADYVLQYLVRTIERLTEEYMEQYDGWDMSKQLQIRHNYTEGVVQGVANQLKASEQAKEKPVTTVNGTELMVVKDKVLDEFLQRKYPRLRHVRTHTRMGYEEGAHESGRAAGEKISIRRGVSKGEDSIKRIGR